ncbi:EAL domain-containing protein [Ampullimonas aquatilis]|uniref:EAL domain-containing protein n=1 Tax=Ampullimonas aquatilis TaxID=1341549 RepID=UPI003C712900
MLLNPKTLKNSPPQRQFIFIQEGHLQEAPTVRNLLRQIDPVPHETHCQLILARFIQDDAIYALPVVNDNRKTIGLLDRKHFIEFFSKPYSLEIFGRRPIQELIVYQEYKNLPPIIVDESCTIEDIAQIIIDAGMQHMVTGFVVSSQGRYLGIANGHDLLNIITQRKQAELYYLAHYDNLTGLPNRMLLCDRLEQACRDAQRKSSLVALLFIDIDRFKHINDSLGHSAGDAILRKIAERLKDVARRTDTVARLAGDEFVILMEDFMDSTMIDMLAQRLRDCVQTPIEMFGHSLVVTVSIGSALYPNDDTSFSPLLAKADAAMYEVKSSGRNGYRAYSASTIMYNPASMLIENDLRLAIERNELVLHFQPQIDLISHAICGVEALVRWNHPQQGLVSPAEFIPIAEESGLIVPLGEWVLCEALRQLKIWQELGIPPIRVSVNMSALQFNQRQFPSFLKARLEEFQVNPQQLELELTESLLMHNVDDVLLTLQEIKQLGVSLAIDDFGTGFSSLSYLRRFPIDRLKIDQSFVRDIEQTPVNESIARSIVALANSLSLEIIAEGIETQSEQAILKHMGCTEGQGYLFAKPLSVNELINWFRNHQEI